MIRALWDQRACLRGLLIVVLLYTAALGGGLITRIHDQLDGEILTYILRDLRFDLAKLREMG